MSDFLEPARSALGRWKRVGRLSWTRIDSEGRTSAVPEPWRAPSNGLRLIALGPPPGGLAAGYDARRIPFLRERYTIADLGQRGAANEACSAGAMEAALTWPSRKGRATVLLYWVGLMPHCAKCHRDVTAGALYCAACGAPIVPEPPLGEAPDPYIGRTFKDTYFIERRIGSGGMGHVYKAMHVTLGAPVALKLLKKSLLADQAIVRRFHREARAASRLRHHNVINVTDFGQTEDGTLFMAMEYVAGRSLASIIKDDSPLAEPRVVRIGAQILAALAEAHAAGILHRDLKPENVMIEWRRDEPDSVKVLDFGIAKIQPAGGEGEGQTTLTQPGLVCGTPEYMSPEQCNGEEVDARSDIYSFGVMLYEMLTGEWPFDAQTPTGMARKRLTEEPIPLAQRRAGHAISADLGALVMRTLSTSRDDRPASADEMRADLLACVLLPETAKNGGRDTPPITVVLPSPRTPPGPLPTPAVSPPGQTPPRPVPTVRKVSFVLAGAALGVLAIAVTGYALREPEPEKREAGLPPVAESNADAGVDDKPDPKTAPVPLPDPEPPKPVAPKPVAPKPVAPKPVAPKPVAPKPVAPKPVPPKPVAPKPVAPKPVAPKPVPPKPVAPKLVPSKLVPSAKRKPSNCARPLHWEHGVNKISTPAAGTGDGVLVVVALPWGEVSLCGAPYGEAPVELRVRAGTYTVLVEHASRSEQKTVTVKAGSRASVGVDFAKD